MTILSVAEQGAEVREHHVPRAAKSRVAHAILDAVESLRASR